MTTQPARATAPITDERLRLAAQAEQRLLAHYSLQPRTRYVDVPRVGKVRALDVGSGPPLLLVSGGSGEAFQYYPLMARVTGRTLIAFDRPGGGMSDGVDHRRFDLRRLATDTLTAILDAYGLESAPVVGSSMGGLWTFWLALDRPERVSAVAQFGCPALALGTSAPPPMRLISVPYLNRLIFPLAAVNSADKARGMLGMTGCPDSTVRSLPDAFPETMHRMFTLPNYRVAWLSLMESVLRPWGAAARYRLGPQHLAAVRQPTLFVWGDNDVFGNVEVGRQAAGIVRNARLEIVPGGHIPVVEHPDRCAQLLDDFLSHVAARSDPPSAIPAVDTFGALGVLGALGALETRRAG